ncbi:hypothetical protein ACWDV7_23430 [Streptomyces sp. NPDC003362]
MSTAHETVPRVGCVVDDDGRIVFEAGTGAADGARLLLRLRPKKGQPEKVLHELALEADDHGRRRAVLGSDLVLAEGRWDVFLLWEPGAERQRLRPGPRDLRALVDGRPRDRRAPLAVRIPYVTKDGHLAIRAWVRPAHAEVDRIDVTDRAVTVRARLHGVTLREEAAVRLRLRGGGGTVHTVRPVAGPDGHDFSVTVGHEELAAHTGVWDVFLQPAAEAPLIRLARLLDDVADRKEVFVYPAVPVGDAAVRPYYTVDNDLSVEVTRPG